MRQPLWSAAAIVTACAGLTLAATLPAAAGPPGSPTRDPCFGAAARDPQHPCDASALALTVVPSPRNARARPDAPCTVVTRRPVFVCAWGTPRRLATRTVALVGDSHAAHWRPAVDALVRHEGWRGVSMSRPGCAITSAVPDLGDPRRSRGCVRWNREVQRWLRTHPEVSVVFLGQHRLRVRARKGHVAAATRDGYRTSWRRLLAHHVRHVVVLRDTPRDAPSTQACVEAALVAGVPAGSACAVPRRYALPPDPAVLAAHAAHDARVQVADLSRIFCDHRACLPVIGGALVHRDTGHLTRQFATTLGPLLLDVFGHLTASWPEAVPQMDDVTPQGKASGDRSPLAPPRRAATSPGARSPGPPGPAARARP